MRRLATALLLSGLVVGLAAPAQADPSARGPLPRGASGTSGLEPAAPVPSVPVPSVPVPGAPVPSVPVPGAPSAAELAARAAQDAAALAQRQAADRAARTAAAAVLERYQTAQRRSEQLARSAQAAQEASVAAARAAATARAQLERAAAATYRTGSGDPGLSMVAELMGGGSSGLLSGLSLLQRVSDTSGDVLDVLEKAQARQRQAARTAAQAAQDAEQAAEQARVAKAEADRVVAETAARLGEAAATARASAAQARRAAEQEAALERLGGKLVACSGGSLEGAPNGQLPLASLCPLWGAPQHRLRADAAEAFNALSRLFALSFGAPLCVGDSYRDYAGQVAVRAAKPTLAAVPGTSNHGWGVALDLCGGVEVFGSAQHTWMQENAVAFGWFHPAWAQEGGSRPEAWHWEFAG